MEQLTSEEYMKSWDYTSQLARIQDWLEWADKIPFMQFPETWEVKAIPNMCGSIIRYKVRDKKSKLVVSIYLDGYDLLGCVGEPYWEAYPINDDVYRVPFKDHKKLIRRIEREFNKFKNVSRKK